MARCPEEELPSQERLVSIFLEGLTNRELHAALYMQRHKNLNQCIHDALDYDDNCDRGKTENDTSSKASVSSTSAASQVDEIIKGVTEKMKQMYGPPRAYEQRMVDRPYVCGNCGGKHSTSQCLPRAQGVAQPEAQTAQWCDFHQRWGNHATENCYDRIRHLRGQAMGNAANVGAEGDRALPVLDRQPPLPNTAPVRIINREDGDNQERALVPVMPY